MKTKPITLYPHEIRRLLDECKVTLWRVVKPQPIKKAWGIPMFDDDWYWKDPKSPAHGIITNRPNGPQELDRFMPHAPGSRCWVRETWVELLHTSPATDEPIPVTNGDRLIEHATRRPGGKGWYYDGKVIAYRATTDITFCDGDGFSAEGGYADKSDLPRWRSPLHMPEEYSRLSVTISRVTVQRVGDVTESVALDAGIKAIDDDGGRRSYVAPRDVFAYFWNQHNRKHQFADNPWAWCYDVEKV